ncbi:alpha/beta hydrolase [Streptomyces sp. A7024]|uniref:Alpha/beta hydrolase n=1 Tax=Streptomyces coryli TaxID=1128680 RepID=A0A6G4UB14_9ACTN|nr:alpha/beta hydrolase [Streptomyces coryli]NGN69419.1 alpha/beta hydrolase [Streptomyces coryli]
MRKTATTAAGAAKATRTATVGIAGALTAALLLLTGCSGGDSGKDDGGGGGDETASGPAPASGELDLPGSITGQRADWNRCSAPTVNQGRAPGAEGPPKALAGTDWECTKVKVPLDYDNPGGKTIDIALIRAKAKEQGKQRIGSLLFNFGGPGGSGVTTMPQAADPDYKKLNTRYDLVSFDPRGVGESATVKCRGDDEMDASRAVDGTPDDRTEFAKAEADQKAFTEGCDQRSGDRLRHMTTTNTARDMDVIRQLLGDEKLHYFGISYGTQLGGVYAHLFPKRVGRAVLDAVVDPTKSEVEGSLAQAKGFQLALGNYMKDCAKQAKCPTGKGGAEGTKRITDLLAQLDKQPMKTQLGRELTQGDALTGIASLLYSKETWKYLTQSLQKAEQGDGSYLLLFADVYTGRDQQGNYNNENEAHAAIACADTTERYAEADVRKQLPRFKKASPIFGEMLAWGLLGCSGWPAKGEAKTPEVSAPDAAKMLVIGNTGDPATPYEGAANMADQIGDSAVQLTYEGEGHGAYGQGDCVTTTVDDYLLDGKVPEDGKRCS